jgi:hypothetical protein
MDAARVLAKFANLEPDGVENFRKAHPDFVPQAWWDYRPTAMNGTPLPEMQWQINQKVLRDAWLFEFNLGQYDYVRLLTSVFDPNETYPPLFERRYRPISLTAWDLGDQLQYEPPYYLAVKWLGGQGWRAKTCWFCEKRFVAEHSKTKFCSYGEPGDDNWAPNCFQAHRRKYQQEYWDECRDRTNKRRRQEYKLEKKGSRLAKRKTLRQG